MSVKTFPEVKKMLGFGCMRLPMDGDKIDIEQFKKMVDVFMANGFNYFDTAHIYHDGESEKAIREAVSSRYPRESFILTDKLTTNCFNKQEDIRPLFKQQLKDSGVDYFDFYLMHSQDAAIYEKFRRCNAYETALEMQKEGKFRHFGISFHDKAEVLEQILKDYPQIEAVQIQFNYLDYGDPAVDSKRVYEVCEKYGKAVIVMEPVKGGNLVKSPLVGTFYTAPSEDAEPFIKVGDTVKKGQTLAIVEAMKLMNEIESEFDGVVTEILVENEENVEYGQPLFRIQ